MNPLRVRCICFIRHRGNVEIHFHTEPVIMNNHTIFNEILYQIRLLGQEQATNAEHTTPAPIIEALGFINSFVLSQYSAELVLQPSTLVRTSNAEEGEYL